MRKRCATLVLVALITSSEVCGQTLTQQPLTNAAIREVTRLSRADTASANRMGETRVVGFTQQPAIAIGDDWDNLVSTRVGTTVRIVFADGRAATGTLVGATADRVTLADLKTTAAGVPSPATPPRRGVWTYRRPELARAEIVRRGASSTGPHTVLIGTALGAAIGALLIAVTLPSSGGDVPASYYIGLGAAVGAGAGAVVGLALR
jgi:hypothetical protein